MSPADRTVDADDSHAASFAAGERPSDAVVTAVATATGESPLELSPLYESIDPDALDALFSHAGETAHPGSHELQFSYEGCAIHVRGDGRITVEETTQH